MARKQEINLLGECVDFCKYMWRHRKGNSVPGTILDTMDVLFPEDKPRPLLTKQNKLPNGWNMIFTLRPGVSFQDVEKKKHYFEDACRLFVNIEKKGGFVHFNIYTADLEKYYRYEWDPASYREKMALPIPIGYTTTGEIEVVDLAALPHMRVGGTTFTGKSNFLHTVFMSLAMLPNVRLAVIDLALLEFSYTRDFAAFASDTETALKLLRALEKEMHRRRKVLNAARVVKLQEYKGEDLPYIVLIIDEFAFMNPDSTPDKEEKELRKECQSICANLAALARKVGIHCIFAMQRPDMKILPGQLKANLPGALSFRTINQVNSEIILDNGAAYELPDIQGRAVWQVGNTQKVVQVMHLPLNMARKMLKEISEGGNSEKWIELQTDRLLPR